METKEDQHLDETEKDSTLDETRESEDDSLDFASLFGDSEDDSTDAPVSREEYERLKKGIKKLASKVGREQKEKPMEKKEETKEASSEVLELFYETKPEAALVSDDLKTVAKAKGISEIQAWKSESWIQEKARALQVQERNKAKVGDPSGTIGGAPLTDVQKIAKKLSGNLPPGFSAEKPKL